MEIKKTRHNGLNEPRSQDGWPNREVTMSSVATLISCGTPWHLKPKENCKVNGNVKTTKKNREQAQIIESEFRKQSSAVGKTDQSDKGQYGQFTFRGDSWPKCPLKCVRLK